MPSTEAPTVQLYACRGRLVAVPSLIVQRKPGSQSRQASPVFSGARPLVQMRPSKNATSTLLVVTTTTALAVRRTSVGLWSATELGMEAATRVMCAETA